MIELAQAVLKTDIAVAIQQCYASLLSEPHRTRRGLVSWISPRSTSIRPLGARGLARRRSSVSCRISGNSARPRTSDQPAYIRDHTPEAHRSDDGGGSARRIPARSAAASACRRRPLQKLIIKGISDGVFVYQREGLTAGKNVYFVPGTCRVNRETR